MPTFNTQKLLPATTSQIPAMAESIRKEFADDGFEVQIEMLMSGGRDISLTKGSLFKAVLGMRSALKITLTPQMDGVFFDARVGIFGQQAIPTVISMFFFWPVLITQIWGLINQSGLDDRSLAAAERGMQSKASSLKSISSSSNVFCTHCGARIEEKARFCSRCGERV